MKKLIVKILIGIGVLIALPLIIALFVKREYAVQREITINRPRQQVFNYVKHLKNQDKYNKWVMVDPDMKKIYKGTDGTVGFIYAWDGNDKAGKGEQEIKSITEGEKVELEIRFIKPFEGLANVPFTTESVSENQTRLKWGMSGKSTYPMNFMNLFMDNMLGKDLEASLAMLKANLEEKQEH